MKLIIAQIFGIGAIIALFTIYQQKTRKKLIISKLCADLCWSVHYFLLGGMGAAVVNFVGIFRELIFMRREEKLWANKIIWPFLFILCGWTLGISTFKTPINILPIATSTFVTVSLWVKNPRLTKIITVPVCMLFIVYDIYVKSYIGIINESISICSILISLIKERLDVKNGKANI